MHKGSHKGQHTCVYLGHYISTCKIVELSRGHRVITLVITSVISVDFQEFPTAGHFVSCEH